MNGNRHLTGSCYEAGHKAAALVFRQEIVEVFMSRPGHS